MRIVIVNTFDKIGGAAIAAYRLFKGLQNKKQQVNYLVRKKIVDDKNVIATSHSFFKKQIDFFRFVWERFCFRLLEHDKSIRFAFSIANIGENISKNKIIKQADIIHLNWTNVGFLSLRGIRKLLSLNKPVIWTMHDMWLMTGGCHHAYECTNFFNECGNCMYLRKPKSKDISYRILKRKKKIFSKRKIHIVAVSNWLAGKIKQSALFKDFPVYVIHNSIDTQLFRPIVKAEALRQIKLPDKKIYLLFGASRIDDPIKGWAYFSEAIKILCQDAMWKNKIEIITFGRIKSINLIHQFNIVPIHHYGVINDVEKLCNLYNCADITITSSLYETQGQVAVESLCCGIPVVAFNTSGLAEVINHKENGYLAAYKSSADLAEGIKWCLDKNNYTHIVSSARPSVEEKFSEQHIVAEYLKVYEQALKEATI